MKKAKRILKKYKKQKGYEKMRCAWSDEEVVEILQTVVNKNCNIQNVSGSALTAVNMLRDCVEVGKYKAWNCEVGEKKAQEIMDSFHNGKYGRGDGFWVQVGWAISKMEQHYR